jgi:hypothetical protein
MKISMDVHNNEYPKNIKGYKILRNIGKGAYGNVIPLNAGVGS